MTENSKRKHGPGASRDGASRKKSKGGGGSRWQTPHYKAIMAGKVEMGTAMDVGDEGIWVTYARGMKAKAVREFKELCELFGKDMYGIKPSNEEPDEDEDAGDKGIDVLIEQELDAMRAARRPKTRQTFTPISTNLECVFFMKTMKPVEPDRLVKRICEDAKDCSDLRQRKTKYINRLTPVFDTDKATDKAMERVARRVLAPWFSLTEEEPEEGAPDVQGRSEEKEKPAEEQQPCTYAIRSTIRHHASLRSDAVIKKIAGIVEPRHKVNLTSPDKVILVEVFQLFCGVSVVDGKAWEELKKYNVSEVYKLSPGAHEGESAGEEAKNK